MAGLSAALEAHLAGGLTTLCHAWAVNRADGVSFGFTDHDLPLSFEGRVFEADSGLGAKALAQSTGLSVDNTEALGALSARTIREDEIEQGRFDGAEVLVWLVNWADVTQRWLQFRGTIGEIARAGGAFKAELRGLTEMLNVPQGRVFQKPCTAVLGDKNCRFDLNEPGFVAELPVALEEGGRTFTWDEGLAFDPDWFTRGRFEVLDGPAKGLWGVIKHDRQEDDQRIIELWEPIRGDVGSGTLVRLHPGCDKRLETCRIKFNNIRNYQGFPDLPNDDWMLSVPRKSGSGDGGSLR